MSKTIAEILKEQKELSKQVGIKLDDAHINRTIGIRNAVETKSQEEFIELGKKVSESKLKNDHPTRGKKLPKNWTEAMSKSLKGHVKKDTSKMNKCKMKPLMTPDGPFESTKAATAHYGFNWAENCTHKIKKQHPGWYWITKEQYIELTGHNPF